MANYRMRIGYGEPSDVPSWVPAAGEVATLTVANGGLANNFEDVCSSYYDPFRFVKITNSYGGGVKNPYWGDYGGQFFFSGGHSNSNDNSAVIMEYRENDIIFKRITDPAPFYGDNGAIGDTIYANANGDIQEYIDWIDGIPQSVENPGARMIYGEYNYLPSPYEAFNGQPGASHTYGIPVVIPPANGGATYGTILLTQNPAIGTQNQIGAISGHALDLIDTSATFPLWWYRHTDEHINEPLGGWNAPCLCTYIPEFNRVHMTHRGNSTAPRWYDIDIAENVTGVPWVDGTGTPFDYYLSDSIGGDAESGCQFHIPERGLLVCCWSKDSLVKIQWMDITDPDPTLGGTATLSQTLSTQMLASDPEFASRANWGAATWCPYSQRIICAGVEQDDEAAYEIEIPVDLEDDWTVTRAPYGTGQTFYPNNHTCHHRFGWDATIEAIVYHKFSLSGVADSVRVYKPRIL